MTIFSGPHSERLRTLLREYNEIPQRRAEISAEIHRAFDRDVAILVLDSSGFSRATQTMGIVHVMALLERLERSFRPLVQKHGGAFLRAEADNLFAHFPDPDAALACASEMVSVLSITNEAMPASEEIYASIGIGFGTVLFFEHDMFGNEMNLACKLGEDLAGHGEVLVTERARNALRRTDWELEPCVFSVSGLDVPAYRLRV